MKKRELVVHHHQRNKTRIRGNTMINREKLYNLIYNKADKLLKQYNPCNIRTKNNRLICNNGDMCEEKGESLCCSGCEYLGENGCTIKCLECKIGMCWWGESMQYTIYNRLQKNLFNLRNIPHKFINQMDKLRKITYKYHLSKIRTSKEMLLITQKKQYPLFYWKENE